MSLYERWAPVARLLYARMLQVSGATPKPRDAPAYRTGAPDAERVLLIGNGASSGWGVVTHQLALTGQLGRELSRSTGVPTDVDYIGDVPMVAESALSWIGSRDLRGYDAVLIVLGGSDAARLTPPARWTEALTGLLLALHERTDAHARILVGAIPPFRDLTLAAAGRWAFADRHARRLNTATRRIVAGFPRVSVLETAAPGTDTRRPEGSPEYYRRWAAALGDDVAAALTVSRVLREDRRTGPVAEPVPAWPGMTRAVEDARGNGSPELQRIAAEARRRFGTEVATVSVLDGDRVHYLTGTDVLPMSVPAELTHCSVVVAQDAALVVPDSRVDDRFRDNPFTDVTHAVFYAGHPIRSSTGETIGAFCVIGGWAKPESAVPLDELRDFALRAEAEVQRLEHAGAAAG